MNTKSLGALAFSLPNSHIYQPQALLHCVKISNPTLRHTPAPMLKKNFQYKQSLPETAEAGLRPESYPLNPFKPYKTSSILPQRDHVPSVLIRRPVLLLAAPVFSRVHIVSTNLNLTPLIPPLFCSQYEFILSAVTASLFLNI